MYRSIAITTLILSAAAFAWADDGSTFQWQGEMQPGQTLAIRGVNGGVTADLAPGALASVTAVKTVPGDDPSIVRIQVVPGDGGVTVCAVYPGFQTSADHPCGGQGSDVTVTGILVAFTVHVPAGVALDATTVNGDVRASGLTGSVRAVTVSGQIALTVDGPAQANTVNGSIVAVLGKVDWTGTRAFATVNGSIDATIPASADVVVHASTVTGAISTGFPLVVNGWSGFSCGVPPTLNGTLGLGGRGLDLATVNGSIHLRKSQ